MSSMKSAATTPLAVSPAEAARLLGMSRSRLYDLLTSGEIASFKTGHARLIPYAALTAWVDGKLAASQP